jgi:hypothetical protein
MVKGNTNLSSRALQFVLVALLGRVDKWVYRDDEHYPSKEARLSGSY